jgi:hypothetical protein
MADAFAAALKDFERVMAEIGETRERLQTLEKARDQLRKQLRSLAGSSEFSGISTSHGDAGPTLAITEIVNTVRHLGGAARLADVAKSAGLDVKVAATRIQRAVKAGLLMRAGHGQYQLPADQLQALISGTASVSDTVSTVSAENQ